MSNLKNFLFTSESVSEGHPDKVSDRISDMVVDSFISGDPYSRVACETLTTTNKVVLAGEVRGPEINKEDLIKNVRDCIKDIGYDQDGFSWKEQTKIETHLHSQSADIAMGVDSAGNKDEGAGDQGIMFGYACNETTELMPATLSYSHQILKNLADKRKNNIIQGLLPDSKSQLTLFYENDQPKYIDSIVVSSQHTEDTTQKYLNEQIAVLCKDILPSDWYTEKTKLLVNPTGNFVIGGPVGDTGLTGRKIIVDTYGGASPHGGGAFSGKDPTKVDRSAAYVARYLAKNIVHSGISEKCTIQLSYAIGISEPLSIFVDLHGNKKVEASKVEKFIKDRFDLSPRGIINMLGLSNPIFSETSSYGHFGRVPNENGCFTWENLNISNEFKNEFL